MLDGLLLWSFSLYWRSSKPSLSSLSFNQKTKGLVCVALTLVSVLNSGLQLLFSGAGFTRSVPKQQPQEEVNESDFRRDKPIISPHKQSHSTTVIINNDNRQLIYIHHNQCLSPWVSFISPISDLGGRGKFQHSIFQKHAVNPQVATLISIPSVFSEQEVRKLRDHQRHQGIPPPSAAGHTLSWSQAGCI